ncbi:MAG: hypothetical protein NVS2B7_19590 [Herpetosiphon sp.]
MAGSADRPELAAELSELTVPELHVYIHRLRDLIRGLEAYTTTLQAELNALEHREFLAALRQP